MWNNRISDDQQKLENPLQYYLNNINDDNIMAELAWEDPGFYQHVLRTNFIHKIQNHENIYKCPECRGKIITDEWGEEYCETCGLVTRTQNKYVAGHKIRLPYGLK